MPRSQPIDDRATNVPVATATPTSKGSTKTRTPAASIGTRIGDRQMRIAMPAAPSMLPTLSQGMY